MIEYIFSTQSIEALGWTLLHSLWQGAAFAFLLVLILILLRSYSAISRYVVSVGMLCAFFVTLSTTFWVQWQEANNRLEIRSLQLDRALTSDSQSVKNDFSETLLRENNSISAFPTNDVVVENNQSNWLSSFRDYYNQHLPLLVTIWFLGVLFLQLRFLGQLAYVQRLKHYGTQLFPDSWNEKIEELEGKLRIQKQVAYLTSRRIESPMVIGWLKPVILMPQQLFDSLSETEIYVVIAHELAHIRREDFIVNLMQNFLCNIFFFHPGVWWISNRIDDEREHCCDDLAIAATGPATTYAKTLINVSEFQLNLQHNTPLAMAFSGKRKKKGSGGFSDRIRRLLIVKNGAGTFREGFASAFILITAMFLGVAATGSTIQEKENSAISSSEIDKTEVIANEDLPISNITTPIETDNNPISIIKNTTGSRNLPIAASSTMIDPVEAEKSITSDETRIDALVMACKEGDLEFVKSMVKLGLDINSIGSQELTPLMMATSNQEDEIVEYLLKQGADVNQVSNGWTALIEAADEGSLKSMKPLLKAGADVHYYHTPQSPTAISMAASEGHRDCLKLLLEYGADINGVGKSIPPLHIAAEEGRSAILDFLITRKVNINKKDALGRTALMYAATEGKKSTVIKLVKAGADIRIIDLYGANAMDYASEEDKHDIRDYLESQDALFTNRSEEDQDDQGDGEHTHYDERPKIHQLTLDGLIEKVQIMVERGTDVNSIDYYGRTPLHIASAEGHNIDMRVLMDLGANINTQDNQGRTPLMYAAADGKGDAVALLVSKLADANIKDIDGMRAYEWAQSGNNEDLANFLGLITDSNARDKGEQRILRTKEIENREKNRQKENETRQKNQEKRIEKEAQRIQKTEQRIQNRIENDQHFDRFIDFHIDQQTEVPKDVHSGFDNVDKRETFHIAPDGTHLRQFNLENETPALFEAVRQGSLDDFYDLINKDNSANTADDTGQTALMIAASTNRLDIAKILIERGADVNMSSASGLTALHYAALENHDQMVQLLLNNNANIDPEMHYSSTDGNNTKEPLVWEYMGATPLLIAVESKNIDVISVLIDAGANTNHALIRNEYRLHKDRENYLGASEVLGLDGDFLQDGEIRISDKSWTPYKQALLLNDSEILTFFRK